MILIGVTGLISSGKTTVSSFLKKHGAIVMDADDMSNGLLNEPAIRRKITGLFGDGILAGGSINRNKLAAVAFKDKTNIKKLCGILHPEVIRRIYNTAKKSGSEFVIVDAPLLIEAGMHKNMDAVILVKASKKTMLSRWQKKGRTRNEFFRRLKYQMPFRQRSRYADFIIDNNGSLKNTKQEAEKVWSKIVE